MNTVTMFIYNPVNEQTFTPAGTHQAQNYRMLTLINNNRRQRD